MGLLSLLRVASAPPETQAAPGADVSASDWLQVLSPTELLQAHEQTIGKIRQQVGVPLAHWNALYRSLIERFAEFVQLLPASEAHHHRERGGLLKHALETALKALTIRRGVLLPHGASAEALADKQDVWTYATASAALLHDLGKPLVDQKITLCAIDGRLLGRWNPLAGPIRAPATRYTVRYIRGRRYRLHPRLPPMLAHHVVPAVALEWLAQDLDVFEAWLATISGGDSEFAGALGQIIKQADGLSVAADLSGDSLVATTGGRRPLAERLALALRKLVESQALPLNRPGAAGFVFDDDLWLVSKRALDALREELTTETPSGVPNRNERLMDELQQHGILMPNGDRAIWNGTVELGDWRQTLTLLRFPLTRLWIDPAARPGAAAGRVTFDPSTTPATLGSDTPGAADNSHGRPELETATARIAVPAREAIDLSLPLPPLTAAGPSETAPAPELAPPVATEHSSATGSPLAGAIHSILAENDVIRWITEGIASGRLKLNTADARIHMTAEGLLLVSPGIFRDFGGVDGWLSAQKRLLKLKAHRKNSDGTNIWTYRVVGERRSSAQLKGILIQDASEKLGLRLPEPNPHLVPIAAAGVATKTEAADDGTPP